MKNSMMAIVAGLLFQTLCADNATDTATLEENKAAKANLSSLKGQLASQQDSNSARKAEISNIENSISQQEWILSGILNPDSQKPWTPEANPSRGESLVDIKFSAAEDLPKGMRLPRWASVECAPDGIPALKVSIDEAELAKTKGLNNIPVFIRGEKVAGRNLVCQVKVLGTDIRKTGAAPILGGKFMLNYTSGGRTCWPGDPIGEGSFGWRDSVFTAKIPSDVQGVIAYLGLQGATGTIWFRDLKIEAMDND